MPSDSDDLPEPPEPRRRPSNAVIATITVVLFVMVVTMTLALSNPRSSSRPTVPSEGSAEAAEMAARPDSNRLSSPPGSAVTFVEFLDFECEACGQAFPAIEELRAQYGDRVSFVIRYFPIQSHFNAERAARAVEAAAQQGRLEPMYKMMYETQSEWGEQQVPMDDRFRGYAQQLGLDMGRFDEVYNAPATLERINADRADGLALGVQGTPSFFVNGQRLQPQSTEDLTKALDDALATTP